jgi:hypothetical protein
VSFNIVIIRDLEDTTDDVMYPAPGHEANSVRLGSGDGPNVLTTVATAISIYERYPKKKMEALLKVSDIKATLHITDSRVAIACTKYDKGGGWSGGVTALAFNAVSKARAAVRRKGNVLVGQVRFPWLSDVGFKPKTGWLSDEQLRIVANDKSGGERRMLFLDLTFPKSISAEQIAREVASRAAKFRLNHTKIDSDEEREKIEALVDPAALTPEKDKYALYTFPTYFFANTKTAYGDLDSETTA